uniref:Biotin carboxyl carrier protein of acetyl-CoA carboxylase n=1 Tax=Symphyocladiella dendroidea TaxID=2506487 RepID=A0A1Z1M7U6_9FLOR|nr:acetyl-CoA carboxylase biotin carboxyl carrier protein [Symphyocladiella dendroidea]ARW61901.1 acetyl-CoA carboxylase biotin carboxyl carrier protein [Symphyocladiella dendroidea]
MIKIQDVTKLINSIHQKDIENLKLEKKNTKIAINKLKISKKNHPTLLITNNNSKFKKNTKKIRKTIETRGLIKEIKTESNIKHSHIYSTIISPMVGTFYKSPAPNENAFIEIGETVKPKQIVCIIEAMKLMNEIESEVTGEVVEILVKDGDIVDCGQALVKIKVK